MTIDRQGNIFLPDYDMHDSVDIRKIAPGGAGNHAIRRVTPDGTVSTIAGMGIMGNADGDSAQAMFKYPYGLTIDKAGAVFVADNGNCRIRKLEYK